MLALVGHGLSYCSEKYPKDFCSYVSYLHMYAKLAKAQITWPLNYLCQRNTNVRTSASHFLFLLSNPSVLFGGMKKEGRLLIRTRNPHGGVLSGASMPQNEIK